MHLVPTLVSIPRWCPMLEVPVLAEGKEANLVVFDKDAKWIYDKFNNKSKSYNSPFIGQKLTGSILLTYNNNKLFKS